MQQESNESKLSCIRKLFLIQPLESNLNHEPVLPSFSAAQCPTKHHILPRQVSLMPLWKSSLSRLESGSKTSDMKYIYPLAFQDDFTWCFFFILYLHDHKGFKG